MGSSMIPLSIRWSQESNQRCTVSTQYARRKSNGSACPVCDSQSFRGTWFAARPAHQLANWSGLTLLSLIPWTTKTLARTLPTSGV